MRVDMSAKKQSGRIVGSVLVGGEIRPFSFTLSTQHLDTNTKTIANPGQPEIDQPLRSLLQRMIRDSVSEPVEEIRFGEYFCPKCQRWIDATSLGAWALNSCAPCVLGGSG